MALVKQEVMLAKLSLTTLQLNRASVTGW